MVKSATLLLLLLWFLIKIPAVQNFVAWEAAAFFSKEWGTKVEIGRVDLELFNKLVLYEVYVEDLQGDTLLAASELRAYVDELSIMRRRINIGMIDLNHAAFRYVRLEKEKDFNLYFILRYFKSNKEKTTKSKPFSLGISKLRINDLDFKYYDGTVGTDLTVSLPRGLVDAKQVDLIGKSIDADSVWLDRPNIFIRIFKGEPYPGQFKQVADGDTVRTVAVRDETQPAWNIRSKRMQMRTGRFQLLNTRFPIKPERPLDYNDLQISDLEIDVVNFALHKEVFKGDVRHLAARERRGFHLLNLSGLTELSSTRLRIRNLRLRTPWSDLGDDLEFRYERYSDFYDFVNKVHMNLSVRRSDIRLKDVMYFAFPLEELAFFRHNAEEVFELSGKAWGTVNDLHSDGLRLASKGGTVLDGSFDMLRVTVPSKERVNYNFKRLTANLPDLRKLLAFINLPSSLDSLGSVTFSGSYRGQFRDFNAKGLFSTKDAGEIEADFRLNLYPGVEKARYEGFIDVRDINLGSFINDKRFAGVSLATGISGQGLTLASAEARLDSTKVRSFWFKDYNYERILIDGQINQKRFEGFVSSADPNVDLRMQGLVDFTDSLPVFDFRGKVSFIDFQALHLSKEALSLHLDTLDLQAKGNTFDNLDAWLNVRNMELCKGEGQYALDSIQAALQPLADTTVLVAIARGHYDSIEIREGRQAYIHSDLLTMDAWGTFDLVHLPLSLRHYARRNFPNFYRQFLFVPSDTLFETSIDSLRKEEVPQKLVFRMQIDSSRHFTELIHPDFKALEKARIRFFFDSEQNAFRLRTRLDTLQWGNISLRNNRLTGSGKDNILNLDNRVLDVFLGDSTRLPNVGANLRALGDSLFFGLDIKEIGKVASNIHAGGQIAFTRQNLRISLDSSNLTLLDQHWSVSGDNYLSLSFSKDSLKVHNLQLSNGPQRIAINSFGAKGLDARVQRFDLGWLYSLVKIPQIDILGALNAQIQVQDVLAQKGLKAQIDLDSLRINGDDWRKAELKVEADSLRAPLKFELQHKSEQVDTLWVRGEYIPPFATEDKRRKNRVELDFEVYQAQARIVEYFLTGMVSNTVGLATASGHILGEPRFYRNAPGRRNGGMVWDLRGSGLLGGVATNVNVLKIRDSIPLAQIDITPDGFFLVPSITPSHNAHFFCDAGNPGGVSIYDQEGTQGRLSGGIVHRNLQDFGLDFYICLQNSLVMNTTEKDNSTFYGKIYADGQAHMFGLLNQLKLVVDQGKTRAGSFLALPIGSPQEVGAVQFVTFVDKKKERDSLQNQANKPAKAPSGGLDLLLNIEVTPEATAQIILDAQTGDIVTGNGKGNLSISYTPAGELGILGSYEITKGQYFFTYQNLVNKPFGVQPGGTITWRGDPFEAELNIQASYTQRASLSNLVLPYVVDESSMSLASQKTDVQLLMYLRGALFSPEISFDVAVPQVEPKLRTPVDLALRNVRQDKNELNRQVFALILLKQFLPSEGAGSVNFVSSGANTLSEMLSKQLSMYITDLLAETMLDELDFINAFQFDVDFNVQDANAQTGLNNNNSEVAVGLDNTLFNNRLRVRIGANVDLGTNTVGNVNNPAGSNYIGADFIVEYQIDKNGHFKLRAYNRPENTVLGRVIRTGIGISYRQEFDLSDKKKARIFKRQLKRQLKQAERLQRKLEAEQ